MKKIIVVVVGFLVTFAVFAASVVFATLADPKGGI